MLKHSLLTSEYWRRVLRCLTGWTLGLFVCVAARGQTASGLAGGGVVEYDLRISAQRLAPAGKTVTALTINGGVPGPTLTFAEGDFARIRVHNDLLVQQTSIHWHGLLVPNEMDGVPYLTTPPIEPGESHLFEFPIRQAGTYWYHSHTGLQEQRGVFGSIVIHPRVRDLNADRDHVVVLSDWTNEHPQEVMRTLMRGSEWYSQTKGTAQSILGAWRRGVLGEYFARERSRMPPMDVSDVAYDAFLANGEVRHRLDAMPSERVRLRIINAGASTYFHLSSAAGPVTIVASDGQRVKPVEVNRLLIGMAETYDLIVTMPPGGEAVEVRATAQDVSGHASIILGRGDLLEASDPPRPDLYTMKAAVAAGIESVNPARGGDARTSDRPFAPYALLEAVESTALVQAQEDASRVREIELRLTGDMRRYRWGFNGKTLAEDSVIPVSKGEILRITLVNDTMMHHPLHLHGHFFRLLNGKKDVAPLKHTVDVPPMGKRVIEWVADEEGKDWFFHCHMLYHMDAGMARVFSYQNQAPDHRVRFDPKLLNPRFVIINAAVQSHMTMGRVGLMQGRNDFLTRWDIGLGSHGSGHGDGSGGSHEGEDREIDLAWSRYFNSNFSSITGYRFSDVPNTSDRFFGGVRYRLPYLVQSELTLDDRGDLRLSLQKQFMLTTRLGAFVAAEYDTQTFGEWETGFGWTLAKKFGLVASYHSDHGTGVGLSVRL